MRDVSANSARPGPGDVRVWFTGGLSKEALTFHMRALMGCPDWALFTQPSASASIITFHYLPSGEHVTVLLRCQDDGWHATVTHPETVAATAALGYEGDRLLRARAI